MASQETHLVLKSPEMLTHEREFSELKIQLNACQQRIASLELEVRQKEEVIIKSEADSIKQDQLYSLEINKLKELLKESTSNNKKQTSAEIQEQLEAATEKANQTLNELAERIKKEQKSNQIIKELEKKVATQDVEYKKLSELHEAVKGNLATLEMAFHDVIQKYERAKTVIEGFKANESIFKANIDEMAKNLELEANRYESLKSHAKSQIEKANKENNAIKSKYDSFEMKQNAIIKRMEIKTQALENSLDQKCKECDELAALCDEVTGQTV